MANRSSALQAFAALGDPTRRAIFERLAQSPAPVGELATRFPVTRSAVSQHLRVLKEACLVTDDAEGTRRIYRLDPRGIAAMREWLNAHWGDAFESFKKFVDDQVEKESEE
jgi:DNA-binding transcriptional ArsR family regulator